MVIPDIMGTAGEAESFSIVLYEMDRKAVVAETVESTASASVWSFRTPETGSENLSLLIYAGLRGKTENIGVRLENAELYDLTDTWPGMENFPETDF